MIYGVGIDLVKVDRFASALERWGERICNRLFTPRELADCAKKVHLVRHLAARFAAKEAFLKAIGIGMFGGVTWQEIEVLNEEGGRPAVKLHGEAARICNRLRVKHILVSISHDGEYSIAQVVLEV